MTETSDGSRIDRVENEVSAIRSEMGGLKTEMGRVQADVRGLSGILSRIEQGVARAQEQQDDRDIRSRHSPVALATILVTIMSLLVGGAWMIGSTTASTSVRLSDEDQQIVRLMARSDREMDGLDRRLSRLEDVKVTHGQVQP
jgi:hypothetical protein